MDSLGVNRFLRATCTDSVTHGLSLQKVKVPELLSLYKYEDIIGFHWLENNLKHCIKQRKNKERRVFTSFTWPNKIKM